MTDEESELTPSARWIRDAFVWCRARLHVRNYVLAAVVFLFFACHYRVEVGETAAKRRFGRLVAADIQPGMQWRIPLVDRVEIRPTEEIKRLEIDAQISPQLPMMTGDINFANARLVVQYRISDLRSFLFVHEHPEHVLQDIVRGNFIDTIGSMFIDMVLATEKRFVEEQVLENSARQVLAAGLGVELTSVTLLNIEPPAEAVAAFRAVNDAKLNKQTLINDTHKRVETLLASARGDAQGVLEEAKAGSAARLAQSAALADRFNRLLVAYRAEPEQVRTTEYWDTMRKVIADARVVLLNPDQKPNLAVNLIESVPDLPFRVGGVKPGKGGKGMKGIANALPRHPTGAPIHAADVRRNEDRRPGMGAHRDSAEAHPFPVPNVRTNLPSHELGGKGAPAAGTKPTAAP